MDFIEGVGEGVDLPTSRCHGLDDEAEDANCPGAPLARGEAGRVSSCEHDLRVHGLNTTPSRSSVKSEQMIDSASSACYRCPMPPRTASPSLTPHERAGQTRKERTRRQIEGALIDLLTEKPYDDIRAAHIIERANVGAATFYQVVGDKGRATTGLVLRELDEAGVTMDYKSDSKSQPVETFRETMNRLGRFGYESPTHANAFIRAYFKDVAGLAEPTVASHPAWALVDLVGSQLRAALRKHQGPSHIEEIDLGGFLTVSALSAGQKPHPENWRRRITCLIQLAGLAEPEKD